MVKLLGQIDPARLNPHKSFYWESKCRGLGHSFAGPSNSSRHRVPGGTSQTVGNAVFYNRRRNRRRSRCKPRTGKRTQTWDCSLRMFPRRPCSRRRRNRRPRDSQFPGFPGPRSCSGLRLRRPVRLRRNRNRTGRFRPDRRKQSPSLSSMPSQRPSLSESASSILAQQDASTESESPSQSASSGAGHFRLSDDFAQVLQNWPCSPVLW